MYHLFISVRIFTIFVVSNNTNEDEKDGKADDRDHRGRRLVSRGPAGSHRQYKHPTKPGRVTIPDHGKSHELDHMLVNSILKQAGLK